MTAVLAFNVSIVVQVVAEPEAIAPAFAAVEYDPHQVAYHVWPLMSAFHPKRTLAVS